MTRERERERGDGERKRKREGTAEEDRQTSLHLGQRDVGARDQMGHPRMSVEPSKDQNRQVESISV